MGKWYIPKRKITRHNNVYNLRLKGLSEFEILQKRLTWLDGKIRRASPHSDLSADANARAAMPNRHTRPNVPLGAGGNHTCLPAGRYKAVSLHYDQPITK